MKTHTHTRSFKEAEGGLVPLEGMQTYTITQSLLGSERQTPRMELAPSLRPTDIAHTITRVRRLRYRTGETGFTLIEVLIVIGILAVLAGIVLVAINPARQFRQANNTERESNVNAILSAVGQYTVDNKGSMPTEIQADGDPIGGAGGDDFADLCDALVPKYLPALPVDPLQAQTDADLNVDDKSITEDECDEDYLTGYTVEEENGRTVITAPLTEDVDTGGVSSEPITVTR